MKNHGIFVFVEVDNNYIYIPKEYELELRYLTKVDNYYPKKDSLIFSEPGVQFNISFLKSGSVYKYEYPLEEISSFLENNIGFNSIIDFKNRYIINNNFWVKGINIPILINISQNNINYSLYPRMKYPYPRRNEYYIIFPRDFNNSNFRNLKSLKDVVYYYDEIESVESYPVHIDSFPKFISSNMDVKIYQLYNISKSLSLLENIYKWVLNKED